MEEIRQHILADDAESLNALLSASDKVKKLILAEDLNDPIGSQLASRLFGKEVRPLRVGII
jgi:hypothetical protein